MSAGYPPPRSGEIVIEMQSLIENQIARSESPRFILDADFDADHDSGLRRGSLYGPTPMLGDNDALFKTVKHEGHSARVRHYERATLLFKRAILLLILSAFKISDLDLGYGRGHLHQAG